MKIQKSWKRFLIGGAVATAVVAGLAALTLSPVGVSAQEIVQGQSAVRHAGSWFGQRGQDGGMDMMNRRSSGPARTGENSGRAFGQRGQGAPSGMMDHGPRGFAEAEDLAEALGIDVATLEAAQETAHNAAIEQMVDEGIITQEQADQMAERGARLGMHGFPGHGRFGDDEGLVDHDALLADALDISVTELQDARDAAHEAGLENAVAAGNLSEEQADQFRAMHALRGTIDPEAIMADALDVSVDELREAHENRTMRALIESSGLDQDTLHEAMQAGFQQAVEEAVAEGVITQAQADALEQGLGDGRGFFPDHGGRGGRGGHGGHGGQGNFERGENPQRQNGNGTRSRIQGTGA